LAAVSPILAPPLAGSSTGPSPGAPEGLAPAAVGAPIHSHSQVVAAAPPSLSPPLAGSSTGPSPGDSEGVAPEAVGAPIYPQSPFLAELSPILSPPLSGYASGPSPGAPDWGPPDAVEAPTHCCSPSCTHWYTSDLSRLRVPDQPGPPASVETIDQEHGDLDDVCLPRTFEEPMTPSRPIPTSPAPTSLAWVQLNSPGPSPSFWHWSS